MNFDLSKVKDIHEEMKDLPVYAGIKNLRVVFNVRKYTLPVNLTVLVPTLKRGVHMSRLIKAVRNASLKNDYVENILKNVCDEVKKLHSASCKVIAKLNFPLRNSDQFLKVKIEIEDGKPIKYTFSKLGITACPCSKEITGIGHMQRALLTVELISEKILDFDEVAEAMSSCFSSIPSEFLKRLDEAKLIIKSQENAKFIEDVVREAAKKFNNAIRITGRAFESIHAHDAYAVWSRDLS